GRCRRAAAPQPAHLGPGRRDRAVYRHQTDRRGEVGPGPVRKSLMDGSAIVSNHLRANLWLLLFTVVICSVLYPLALLAVGQTAFREQAQGSLIVDKAGNVIGSQLIARPFSGDEYFQPRPSAVEYNARASGASNYGASNPALRNRVARALGPIVRYGPKAREQSKTPE